jgi:hypothetical protein
LFEPIDRPLQLDDAPKLHVQFTAHVVKPAIEIGVPAVLLRLAPLQRAAIFRQARPSFHHDECAAGNVPKVPAASSTSRRDAAAQMN